MMTPSFDITTNRATPDVYPLKIGRHFPWTPVLQNFTRLGLFPLCFHGVVNGRVNHFMYRKEIVPKTKLTSGPTLFFVTSIFTAAYSRSTFMISVQRRCWFHYLFLFELSFQHKDFYHAHFPSPLLGSQCKDDHAHQDGPSSERYGPRLPPPNEGPCARPTRAQQPQGQGVYLGRLFSLLRPLHIANLRIAPNITTRYLFDRIFYN